MKRKPQVIVSFTSFPGAINFAPGVVESLLAGSVLPDRIVLYITGSQFGEGDMPEKLLELEKDNEIFEIRNFDRDIRSYRKLVPALRDFPEDIIVTVDDDVAYHPHMLRDLLRMHEKFPGEIIAHRAKKLRLGKPYRKWKKYRWYDFLTKKHRLRFDTMQTGVGGVLYPPHSLREDMIDESRFTELAPTADDIWFWAAVVANGRKIVPVPFGYNKPRSLGKPKELSLKAVNFKSGTDRNRSQLEAVISRYPELIKRLAEDER